MACKCCQCWKLTPCDPEDDEIYTKDLSDEDVGSVVLLDNDKCYSVASVHGSQLISETTIGASTTRVYKSCNGNDSQPANIVETVDGCGDTACTCCAIGLQANPQCVFGGPDLKASIESTSTYKSTYQENPEENEEFERTFSAPSLTETTCASGKIVFTGDYTLNDTSSENTVQGTVTLVIEAGQYNTSTQDYDDGPVYVITTDNGSFGLNAGFEGASCDLFINGDCEFGTYVPIDSFSCEGYTGQCSCTEDLFDGDIIIEYSASITITISGNDCAEAPP